MFCEIRMGIRTFCNYRISFNLFSKHCSNKTIHVNKNFQFHNMLTIRMFIRIA